MTVLFQCKVMLFCKSIVPKWNTNLDANDLDAARRFLIIIITIIIIMYILMERKSTVTGAVRVRYRYE